MNKSQATREGGVLAKPNVGATLKMFFPECVEHEPPCLPAVRRLVVMSPFCEVSGNKSSIGDTAVGGKARGRCPTPSLLTARYFSMQPEAPCPMPSKETTL